MEYNDKNIKSISFLFSVLLHAVFFIGFTSVSDNHTSQAQARVYDKRISLNLLTPVKPDIQQEIKPKPVKKKKQKKKESKNKLSEKVKKQSVAPEAVARNVEDDIRRDKGELNSQIRQSYLDYVLNHIEGHKFYPHAARLRSIEGNIQVSFILQDDGSIRELSATGQSILLRRAAKNSVNRALPLPVCPKDVECPIQVNYAMQFQIK